MYIVAGQGQTTPGDKILMSIETSCHFGHLLQFPKKSLKSDFMHFFFHAFIHVYSSRTGADTTPWGKNFDVNRNILSLQSFVASLKKKNASSLILCNFFMILYMYITPGQGQTAPRGQSSDVNRNVTSFICCKFKKMSLKADFI